MELISEHFVKPKNEVLASKNPIYLTLFDLYALRYNPIQRGLLYNYTLDQSTSSSTILNIIDTLKESLSIALVHFYPLAGRFVTETFTDENACSVFIDCNKGPGARLTHVAAPGVKKLDILSPGHVPVIVKKFFELGEEIFNYDCHTKPLLSIQVTELVDGVFIGFTMCHSVVDGTSFMHFLSMLSEIFCSNNASEKLLEISRVPEYEIRQCIKYPRLRLEEIASNTRRRGKISRLKDRVFHFSAASIAIIKAKANKDGPGPGPGPISNVSSFQGLSSLIWRSITKARNVPRDQETTCRIMMNTRPRLNPKLSDNYIGNYISPSLLTSKVDELLGHDLGWAAIRLNETIKAQDDKSIHSTLNRFTGPEDVQEDIHFPNVVLIGGSARFDVYGLEFGLGKAVAVRMGSGNKTDGKITAHSGCEGGGSVDLEVSLEEDHMASLEMDHEFMAFVS